MRGFAWLLLPALAFGLVGCPSSGAECEEDRDCPAGRYCVAQECHFDCTHDADCHDGYRCSLRGRCERFCADDADCDPGLHCEAGECLSVCSTDGECGADEVCTERGRCEPACSVTNGGVEACDGLDNDCDGDTDEDFAQLGSTCSNGACPEGRWICAAGGQGVACDGPTPAADDAICDGLDEDCDGATDEDALERDCPLQQGVCAGATETCLGAGGWSGCDYGPEYTQDLDERCDGLDEDCDGVADEDAALLLVPEAGSGADDGLDNNCNGLIDEPGGVMVPVAGVDNSWIDAFESVIYENADCSGAVYGQVNDDYPAGWPAVGAPQVTLYACSVGGVLPSAHLSWYRADRACRTQGKRLCTRLEWMRACNIGQGTRFPYGMIFVPSACNDALDGLGEPAPTGTYQQCTADGLTYDMSGNLAEWILNEDPEDPGYRSVGGHGYACTLCLPHGIGCRDCVFDDPGDEEATIELLFCDLEETSKNEFPQEMVLPFFGGRCCLDGP